MEKGRKAQEEDIKRMRESMEKMRKEKEIEILKEK
jgi:hypothetical protein